MHPEIEDLIRRLDPRFTDELAKALQNVQDIIQRKAPNYDNVTPVWMRLNKPSDFQTIISIKSERVISELEVLDEFSVKDGWSNDNAIDLIVYSLFLIAYSRFVLTSETDVTKGKVKQWKSV